MFLLFIVQTLHAGHHLRARGRQAPAHDDDAAPAAGARRRPPGRRLGHGHGRARWSWPPSAP
ncbi:MAG: hypothetical protein MZU91_11340 [Desulfosudis oleivorans]|nr:hypothetical protein [Desulfosudis oleivorans]